MTRPRRLIVVTGTGTEVGKTWVSAAVLRHLRATGVAVAARKPAQSFNEGAGPTDAEVLAAATGEAPEAVCPRHRWYERPMAPPMAAAALGRPAFSVGDLVAELRWPPATAVGLVEGVGGPRSPLAADGDTVDLAKSVAADGVVVVAPAGLGAINAIRLAAGPFEAPVIVVLNRFDRADALEQANRGWLEQHGFVVVDQIRELGVRLGSQA